MHSPTHDPDVDHYKNLIEDLPIGYLRTTLDGEILCVNDTYAELVGSNSVDDVLSYPVEHFYKDKSRRAEVLEKLLENGQLYNEELEITTLDGETRWVSMTARLLGSDNDDDTQYFDALVKDVTHRHRREDALREMHSIISSRNHTFEEQVQLLLELGRKELNVEYGTLSQIRGDDYLFEVVSSDDDAIQSGDIVPVSATNCVLAANTEQTLVIGDIERDAPDQMHRAGYQDWGISCYIGAPVSTNNGVYGTFCFYDTTPLNGQFSQWEVTLVDLMSRWVSYELQRHQTNKELERKNEQLEQFASVVSHDLRNPLSVAEGRVSLALDDYPDDENLQNAQDAHQRMEELIVDLLELARSGNALGDTAFIAPTTFQNDWWSTLNTPDATLRVTLTKSIRADPSRFQQLFENLVRNSIEHGSDTITITVGDMHNGFYIEDNGPGVAEEHRDSVFDAGYTTSDNGTGFGLSIVKQIAEAHDWTVTLAESDSDGARFEFTGVETRSQ